MKLVSIIHIISIYIVSILFLMKIQKDAGRKCLHGQQKTAIVTIFLHRANILNSNPKLKLLTTN